MSTVRLVLSVGLLGLVAGDAIAQLRAVPAAPPPTLQPILPSRQPPILPAPAIFPAQVPNNMLPPPVFQPRGYYGGYLPYYYWGDALYDNNNGPITNYTTVNNYYTPDQPFGPARNFSVPPPPANDHPNVARLALQVPTGATVTINGKKVDVSGSRTLESPTLKSGETYTFDVKVTWTENGKAVEEKRTVTMKAGDLQSLQYLALPAAAARVGE